MVNFETLGGNGDGGSAVDFEDIIDGVAVGTIVRLATSTCAEKAVLFLIAVANSLQRAGDAERRSARSPECRPAIAAISACA